MSDALAAETPEESAFFESGGEKSPGQEPATPAEKQGDSAPEGGMREQQAEKPVVQPQDTERPKPGFVPHAALHEERRKRQQLESELAEFRRFKEQIEAEKAKAAIPDVNADPVGHLNYTSQEVAALREKAARQEQADQQRQTEERFRLTVVASERDFTKTTPDYFEAMEHLRSQRDQELQMYGVHDLAERQQIMNREAMGIAWNAMQNGENPAKRAYELAKFRGYKAKPKASEQIETLQKGAEAAKSLSGKGGQSPAALSPEALLDMSDDEFDKHFEKVMRGKK